jgi:thioredoxin
MSVVKIENSKQIEDLIKNTKGKILVIDYWAGWCGPCVGFAPTFQKLAAEFTNCIFAKVEVDECPEAADAAGIQSIPAFHIYVNGARQEVVVGAAETRLRDAIKKSEAKL